MIELLDVSAPQIWYFNGTDIVVCDTNYQWVSILPSEEHYCITAMMNPESRILLWNIDISACQGLDNDSVPWFDDLYLDLVVYPDGIVVEDDRDELEDALKKGDITQEQFNLANCTCNKLKKGILSKFRFLRNLRTNISKNNTVRYVVNCYK